MMPKDAPANQGTHRVQKRLNYMKLYITPGSPYARMTRIMVLEKGLEASVEILAAQTRSKGSPYYQINPSGRVPYLLRDDGTGLEESMIICRYLDHFDGRPRFDL